MPRFYFHIRDDHNVDDHEGREFTCFEQAVVQATFDARDLAAHDLRDGRLNLDHGLEIANEHGEVMLTVLFRDLLTTKEPLAVEPIGVDEQLQDQTNRPLAAAVIPGD